jgi:hypothetical protein
MPMMVSHLRPMQEVRLSRHTSYQLMDTTATEEVDAVVMAEAAVEVTGASLRRPNHHQPPNLRRVTRPRR